MPDANVRDPQVVDAAFRDLHGARLHGFALLVTLGDRPLAATVAAEALNEGVDRAGELSHPERAAAWLRRRVVQRIGRRRPTGRAGEIEQRRAALAEIGVDATAFSALERLGTRDRAALVAATVEGLDGRDVSTIVGAGGARLERLLSRARRRVLSTPVTDGGQPDGPLAAQISDIAARTLR